MTPEHKQIVQNTWSRSRRSQIPPPNCSNSSMFRQLFASTNREAQGKKLMEMLAMAVKGLDNLDQLSSVETVD